MRSLKWKFSMSLVVPLVFLLIVTEQNSDMFLPILCLIWTEKHESELKELNTLLVLSFNNRAIIEKYLWIYEKYILGDSCLFKVISFIT